MPEIEGIAPPARKALHIFYLLDNSGSMAGQKISVLNRAMEETIDALKGVADSTADAQLKIAVMEFNSRCKWLQPSGPENMEDFIWNDLTAGGGTDVGAALKELNSKMSRTAFLGSMTGAALPIVIFMTDGKADVGYQRELEKIRCNKWFIHATKIGLAMGDDADLDMIADIVGSSEAVVKPNDLETFARLIKFVSVTSSLMNSQSQLSNTNMNGGGVLDSAVREGIITIEERVEEAGTIPPESLDDFFVTPAPTPDPAPLADPLPDASADDLSAASTDTVDTADTTDSTAAVNTDPIPNATADPDADASGSEGSPDSDDDASENGSDDAEDSIGNCPSPPEDPANTVDGDDRI